MSVHPACGMHVCMYVYIYIYMNWLYIYIFVYICMQGHVCVYIYTHIHIGKRKINNAEIRRDAPTLDRDHLVDVPFVP